MNTNLATPPIHTSTHFDHCGNKIWVAEASELPRPMCGEVYRDACDLGFRVRSDRTGKIEYFRLKEEKRDAEGDVTVWIFEPADRRLREMGVEFHVLND